MNEEEQKSIKEFQKFVASRGEPPASATRALFAAVRSDLSPSRAKVAGKLALLHLVSGLAILSVCPQLGLGPLVIRGNGLMDFFMHFGPLACAFLCGALFLGFAQILVATFLTRAELIRARAMEWATLSVFAALSLVVLILAGGRGETTELLLWAVGALVGGWLTFEASFAARLRLS